MLIRFCIAVPILMYMFQNVGRQEKGFGRVVDRWVRIHVGVDGFL